MICAILVFISLSFANDASLMDGYRLSGGLTKRIHLGTILDGWTRAVTCLFPLFPPVSFKQNTCPDGQVFICSEGQGPSLLGGY